jgi:general stress protein 26
VRPDIRTSWLIDGDICFETKAKSQKAVNLRRDPKVSCLVEDGVVYEELRGVAIEGTAEITDDADLLWRIGVNIFERYYGPYSDDLKPIVEAMLNKRVAVRVTNQRVRSWDHRKLQMPSTGAPAGTTMTTGGRRAR